MQCFLGFVNAEYVHQCLEYTSPFLQSRKENIKSYQQSLCLAWWYRAFHSRSLQNRQETRPGKLGLQIPVSRGHSKVNYVGFYWYSNYHRVTISRFINLSLTVKFLRRRWENKWMVYVKLWLCIGQKYFKRQKIPWNNGSQVQDFNFF